MLTTEQNELLTRVGPGTPMGEYFRRFWLPAFLARELTGADCDPVRTRILGEDLVAFRDTKGRVGIVDAYCPHRRVSMFFGRNEECGLRCVYHGLKFDVAGDCVDYPSAPNSKLQERTKIKAYPAYEAGGLVWVYMGPAELQPSRPSDMPFTKVEPGELTTMKFFLESNYLQNLEGDVDLEHLHWLHAQTLQDQGTFETFLRSDGISNDRVAHYDSVPGDHGVAIASRWKRLEGGYYWRVNQHILPSHFLVPMPGGHKAETNLWVPADDTHVWRYTVFATEYMPMVPGPGGQLERLTTFIQTERTTYEFPDGVVIDADLPLDRKQNGYNLDRQVQRTQNFSGLSGVLTEDQAITESMGPIADRSREQLNAADQPIIALRQRLLAAVTEFQSGAEPMQPAAPEVFDVVPLDVNSPAESLAELLESHQANVPQSA